MDPLNLSPDPESMVDPPRIWSLHLSMADRRFVLQADGHVPILGMYDFEPDIRATTIVLRIGGDSTSVARSLRAFGSKPAGG
jgi:hypothetical protein